MKRSYSRADWIALLGVGVSMLNMRATQGGSWSLPSKMAFPQKTKVRFPKFRCMSDHINLLIAVIHAKSQDTT